MICAICQQATRPGTKHVSSIVGRCDEIVDMGVVGCPAWADGIHLFSAVSVTEAEMIRGRLVPVPAVRWKQCKCGAIVEATVPVTKEAP